MQVMASTPGLSTRVLRRVRNVIVAVTLLSTGMPCTMAAGVELPNGFSEDVVASGLTSPTNVAFAPDGRMFIAEKTGRVRVLTAAGQLVSDPVLDISDHVNAAVERGLLGIAVDADFATNGYLWLLYNYEHQPGDAGAFEGPKTARLSRVVVRSNNTVENPTDPETVVLGRDVAACLPPAFVPGSTADCLPAHAITHTVGSVKSAPDGTLYVGVGDNSTHQDRVPSHLWTQRDDVLVGKILRVDRQGRGLPGHPFCPGEANLSLPCTKVFAKGLRNPFRFHLREGGGPIVGDVGWGAYEELNFVRPGGNYGWPCYEGAGKSPWEFDPACLPLYAREGTNLAAIPPAWSLSHGLRPDPIDPRWISNGASIIGGPLLTSSSYPAAWRGRVFVADYARSWIAALRPGGGDLVDPAPSPFALDTPGVVDLQQGPDGNLYYVSLRFAAGASSVRRIVFAPGNGVPVPVADATPTSGRAPLTVAFDASRSRDPEGERLTYRWEFGDGASSTEVRPRHTYTVPGTYSARLTVDDGRGRNPVATVRIGVDNTPPRLSVVEPAAGSQFRVGQRVRLRAVWDDDEEASFPGERIRWTVALHHRDHNHPRGDLAGGDVEFTALADHDADSHYVITATVTDAGGLEDSTTFEIHPRTVPLSVRSDPPGASLTYADASTTGFPPIPVVAAPGFQTAISAQPSFLRDGLLVRFAGWSDGGAATHSVTVPDRPADFIARYRVATQGTTDAMGARFVAEGGQANVLTIARHEGRHDVLDGANDVLAAGDCMRVEVNKASCPLDVPLRAELGDGDDRATLLTDLGVRLDGGPGADQLVGGSGLDVFAAGDGDDIVTSRDGRPEDIDCGPGSDRVVADLEDRPVGCEDVDVPFFGGSGPPLLPSAPFGPPPGPAPAPRDTVAPFLTLRGGSARLRMDPRGRIGISLGSISEPAKLHVDVLDPRGRRLARRTILRATPGSVPVLRVRLSNAGRALVRRRGRVTLQLRVQLTDAAGNVGRRTVRLRVGL